MPFFRMYAESLAYATQLNALLKGVECSVCGAEKRRQSS